jgi:hypothetical protein
MISANVVPDEELATMFINYILLHKATIVPVNPIVYLSLYKMSQTKQLEITQA